MSTITDIDVDRIGEGEFWVITFKRQELRNSLTHRTIDQLRNVIENAQNDSYCTGLIIAGGNKIFATGDDAHELSTNTPNTISNDSRVMLWRNMQHFKKPVIMAVEGYAIGMGLELALLGDIIIASEKAKFGIADVKLGLISGFGASWLLTQAIGRTAAMKMALTGRLTSANELLRHGMITEIVQPNNTVPRAIEISKEIRNHGPLALSTYKRLINNAGGMSFDQMLTMEREALAFLTNTKDRDEGINALHEKRKPQFSGR